MSDAKLYLETKVDILKTGVNALLVPVQSRNTK